MRDEYRTFYDHSYAEQGSPELSGDCGVVQSYAVHDAHPRVRSDHIALIRDFVLGCDLDRIRVLEIGAGTGGLQDLVCTYVACDISTTAARFFHKPFVAASATDLPFADNSFDAIWTINTIEHVPNPEKAFVETRRVLRPEGRLFLYPAWYTRRWSAQGYAVRPYADLGFEGKLIKASIPIRDARLFRAMCTFPVRLSRLFEYLTRQHPTAFHYRPLVPNYTHFWVPDSDAINSLDPFEAILWFTSRGDRCLSHRTIGRQFFVRVGPVVLQVKTC